MINNEEEQPKEMAQPEAEMSLEARHERIKKILAEVRQSIEERAEKNKEVALAIKEIREDLKKALEINKRQMEESSITMKLVKEAKEAKDAKASKNDEKKVLTNRN